MRIEDLERATRAANEIKSLVRQATEVLAANYYYLHFDNVPGRDRCDYPLEAMKGSVTTGGAMHSRLRKVVRDDFMARIRIHENDLASMGATFTPTELPHVEDEP